MFKTVIEVLRQLINFTRFVGLILANKANLDRKTTFRLLKDYLKLHIIKSFGISSKGNISLLGHKLYIFDLKTTTSLIESIFIENEYYFRSDTNTPNIIDYGSNIGLSLIYFKTLYPKSRITAYEADPQTFSLLKRNVKSFKLKNIKLVNAAVWDRNGSLKFYVDKHGPGSPLMSVYKKRLPKDQITVKSLKASQTIFENVDMIKIDIEGAEKKVLDEIFSTKKVNLINQISLEYHHHIEADVDELSSVLTLLENHHFGYQIHASQNTPFVLKTFEDIQIHAYRKSSQI